MNDAIFESMLALTALTLLVWTFMHHERLSFILYLAA